MTFTCYFDNYIVMTDDYDQDEVNRGLHLKHLATDRLRNPNVHGVGRVFDENNHFVGVV